MTAAPGGISCVTPLPGPAVGRGSCDMGVGALFNDVRPILFDFVCNSCISILVSRASSLLKLYKYLSV